MKYLGVLVTQKSPVEITHKMPPLPWRCKRTKSGFEHRHVYQRLKGYLLTYGKYTHKIHVRHIWFAIYHQYTPVMLAFGYHAWILWDSIKEVRINYFYRHVFHLCSRKQTTTNYLRAMMASHVACHTELQVVTSRTVQNVGEEGCGSSTARCSENLWSPVDDGG